jgi:hypothetical protein
MGIMIVFMKRGSLLLQLPDIIADSGGKLDLECVAAPIDVIP